MSAFQEIPISKLVPSNYRRHYDESALKEMTESVRAKGVIEPIVCRPLNGKQKGKYEIVAGHRRHHAAAAAGLKVMPAMVRNLSDEEALEIQIIENDRREHPNPTDQARGYKLLLEMGKHTPETLAATLKKSVGYVLGRVKLADLEKTVQEAIASGKIGPGHAILFTRLKNHGYQKEFLKCVLEGDGYSGEPMSVREAKDLLDEEFSFRLSDAPFDTKGCETCFYRSRNQTALFPDLKKTDECMDRSCYQTKTQGHYLDLINQKYEQGFKTLTDEKEIKKHIEGRSKTSARIVADAKDERTYNQTYFPKRYKSECAKCEHHVFFLLEEKSANDHCFEFGELCLNRPCLDAMNKAAKKEERASGNDEGRANPHTLRLKARECRDRFLMKALDPKVDQSLALKQRLAIHPTVTYFSRYVGGQCPTDGSWRDSFIKEYNREYKGARLFQSGHKVYRGIAGIPEARLDAALLALVFKTFPMTDHDVMLQMTPEAGIDMARDFEMDEAYLQGKTKDELLDLIKELGLKCESNLGVPLSVSSKKGWIISCILAQDLVGRVPAAVADVCRLDT